MSSFECKIVSSLEKVFCRQDLTATELHRLSGAGGEVVAFQVACKSHDGTWVDIEVDSPLSEYITIREIGLVPCEMPAHPDDPDILSCEPGLYPDPLYPVEKYIHLSRRNWHALWISVCIPDNYPAGTYLIIFRFKQHDVQYHSAPFVNEQCIDLDVLPFSLPRQQLVCTNWFYADCLMTYYHVNCWSERHWQLIENYVRNMVDHGINMLLTPLWTLPLDTAVGHERPTVQLLDIKWNNGIYSFDFCRLRRWIEMAKRCGVEYFEMAHAFTQWGAEFTPKIVVRKNGVEQRLFGWNVSADSSEYREFLHQLMPPLLAFLREQELSGKCYFHVSDEPEEKHLESYERAVTLLKPLIGNFPVLDALSDLAFYRHGIAPCPVPTTEKLDEFMPEKIEQRWVYYCGNWKDGVPNRQFGIPSLRNRILGVLLYLYNLDGFLNWGYNFWYTQFSLDELDPFKDTNAGRAFCGGGSFQVYPGDNGPIDSLHYEVFREGLQDLRALRLLEGRIGRDEAIRLIHCGLDYRITMTLYPKESSWLLELRKRINYSIMK